MGKKNQKSKQESSNDTKSLVVGKKSDECEQSFHDLDENNNSGGGAAVARNKKLVNDSSSSSDNSSDDDDDDELALDGVLVRNSDVSSSSDEYDEEEDEADEDEKIDQESASNKKPAANNSVGKRNADGVANTSKQSNNNNGNINKKKKKSKKNHDDDLLNVEFTFCDMDENFFHGIKSLLHNSSTVYQHHSSSLADALIENISVGTVVSTSEQYADDGTVFGFASVLNVTTYQASPAVQYLKQQICLKYCPSDRKNELTTILSGQTKRPAGFLLHGRMLNLPIEIVNTLHQQLVLDIDWAVEHAEGGIEEQKSLDFGIMIRIAPCIQEKNGTIYYKFFDDEIFAGRADFTYNAPAPIGTNSTGIVSSKDGSGKDSLSILVLTKAGHRQAMEDLKQMVGI
jgi:BCCIP